MATFKDTISIQFQSALVSIQEATLAIRNAYHSMAPLQQTITMFLLVAMIPVYIGVRVGTEKVLAAQLARAALSAHPSYTQTQQPTVGDVKIIRNLNGTFSAYAKISNPNLDLSDADIDYTFNFKNTAGESINPVRGTTYLLPNEEKYIVVPKIEIQENLASGTLTLGAIDWQKRISIPTVQLKVSEPSLSEEVNPLNFVAEGSVVNNSAYDLQSIRLVFFLYDKNNKVIGISQRDEYTIPAFGRRAYKQLWPGIYKADVAKVQVNAYTNTMDPNNLTVQAEATPIPTPSINRNRR